LTKHHPAEQDEFHDIRDAVAKLCAQFPGEYWRKLDREMAYPKAFVDALTEAGYLSVLIPEEYGCRRSHQAKFACRPSASPSRPRAPTHPR
jgi:acyl-CoA dehydrogenase